MVKKVYGIHPVEALLRSQAHLVEKVYCLQNRNDGRLEAIRDLALAAEVPIFEVTRSSLQEILGLEVQHQGVFATVSRFPSYVESDLLNFLAGKETLVLVLDGVQDPHNLGACLRTADAMGVQVVIAPKNRAVGLTEVVRKVACGAAESVPFIQVTNLVRTLKLLQQEGVWLVGTMGGVDLVLSETDLTGPVAIVMGSEGKGLRRLTRECCDFMACIPMFGTVGSLNVSVATGICLYEVRRQRLMKK